MYYAWQGNRKAAWQIASAHLAQRHNTNLPKGGRAKSPDEFNPFETKPKTPRVTKIPLTRDNIHLLKGFVRDNPH